MMNEVNAQDLVEALELQRNRAMTEAAIAVARTVQVQRENEALKARIAELENEHARTD